MGISSIPSPSGPKRRLADIPDSTDSEDEPPRKKTKKSKKSKKKGLILTKIKHVTS